MQSDRGGELRLETGGLLRYWACGHGRPVLFANGLGAGASAWAGIRERLGAGYRFIGWDYAGLCEGSGPPLGPREHARHGLRVLDAAGGPPDSAGAPTRAAWVGWSLGVQVALEAYAMAPERVSAMVLIGGGPRLSWGRLRHEATFPGVLIPRGLHLATGLPRGWVAFALGLLQSPEAHAWAVRLGLVGDGLSADAFASLVADFDAIDLDRYLETLALSLAHDAGDTLAQVRAPTLAIAAGRDPVTSRAAVERLVTGIAGAEYLVLPSATHFAPVDEADHVSLRIRKFFGERGYPPARQVSFAPAHGDQADR